MKFRHLLQKLRLRSVQLEGARSTDNVDGLGAVGSATHSGLTPNVPRGLTLPPGYVPSQQDERPHS
jgi:hypothetical protein